MSRTPDERNSMVDRINRLEFREYLRVGWLKAVTYPELFLAAKFSSGNSLEAALQRYLESEPIEEELGRSVIEAFLVAWVGDRLPESMGIGVDAIEFVRGDRDEALRVIDLILSITFFGTVRTRVTEKGATAVSAVLRKSIRPRGLRPLTAETAVAPSATLIPPFLNRAPFSSQPRESTGSIRATRKQKGPSLTPFCDTGSPITCSIPTRPSITSTIRHRTRTPSVVRTSAAWTAE